MSYEDFKAMYEKETGLKISSYIKNQKPAGEKP